MVVTTDSGRGAGADPAGDSAGAAVGLSPVGAADLSTPAVVVTAAVGAGAALVVASAAGGAAVTVVVGAALVGVVVCWLCADGAALEVAGEDTVDGGTDETESVTEVVGAVPDAGVSVVVPGAAVVGLVGVAEVTGAAVVAGAVEVVGVVEGLTGGALGVLVGATAGTNCADDGGTV